jgi:glycosyltransferase involved in cell wall biosynthesis
MIRLAILCNYKLLPERIGGMDYFFWNFDQKCKQSNIQIDWFFPNYSDHGAYFNLTVHHNESESVENNFLIFQKQNQVEYSHIITHFVELCTSFFSEIKKISKAKIIAIDHNPRPLKGYPLKKKIIKRIKGIMFSKHIDVFVGVSNYTSKAILNDFGFHLNSKVQTIYNGVILDDILFRKERRFLEPSFVVVSHLRQSKGIQDLIESVHILPENIKAKISITVYGDGPYKSELLKKIEKYDLEKCFSFMGSNSNLKELYSHYDYMLQPTHMECFSLSILESLAANVPVITTNVGGNTEVITDGINGFISDAKDVKTLAIILEDIYSGNKKISINTRDLIANSFSLPKMVENHLKLILE